MEIDDPLVILSASHGEDSGDAYRSGIDVEIAGRQSAQHGEEPPLWELPCHPVASFSSTEEAQKAANVFALSHGYALVVKHTYYDKHKERRRVVYGCDRHGQKRKPKPRRGTKRRPNSSTRRCGCPMVLDVVRVKSDSSWVLEHRGMETTHNHPPTSQPSSHPIHRRADRDAATAEAIVTDAEIGIRVDQTLARLRAENPDLCITARNVYNERQRSVMASLGTRSRIEHLVSILRTPEYTSAVQPDAESHQSHMFFAFNETLDIYARNPDVLVMGCMYKTNGFGMPLLNIVGVSGMNTTLHVTEVFLRGETEQDYCWALTQPSRIIADRGTAPPKVIVVDRDLALLSALERIFPRIPVLLCIWHIIKDVQSHERKRAFPQELDPKRPLPERPSGGTRLNIGRSVTLSSLWCTRRPRPSTT